MINFTPSLRSLIIKALSNNCMCSKYCPHSKRCAYIDYVTRRLLDAVADVIAALDAKRTCVNSTDADT